MKVKILTEGGKSIGLGHLSRCSALYEELLHREVIVDFVVNGDVDSVNFIKEYPIINVDWLNHDYINNNISSNDYVIVDSYLATNEDYLKLKSKSRELFVIDDFGRLHYPEGTIINPSLNTESIDYSCANKHSLLLGPRYVIVRSAFVKEENRTLRDSVKKVIIMMGGTDIRNLTPALIETLASKNPSVEFNVVINKAQHSELNLGVNPKNVSYHSNLTDIEMSRLMSENDIAITAAGQSIYELMATQTPFLAIQVIDNQKNNCDAIIKHISPEIVFHYTDTDLLTKIESAFHQIEDRTVRKELVKKQRQLIDGKGSQRIVDALIYKSKNKNICIREAKLSDIENVYNLSNQDYVRRHSINKEKIAWKDHIKWFEGVISDPDVVFYIVTNKNNDFLGQVRYSLEGINATISISLSKKIQAQGLASFILEESIKKLFNEKKNIKMITAFVSVNNVASIKIFEKVNFCRKTSDADLLNYQLRREQINDN
ncbi:bifunctional UDP-2,4-diacetamido-2,4,6-trideoxy-beta-L-altropyranose hydrolase/GNAT family N-acetyltransferase [Alkalibacterium kapii]|uniref:N-acetyltransferase domain-containing protein n=1 Tax=Alkalibacterium kapii TaxID=426704 RepID=A0A511AS52_9LACT|nr:bifunctional UDP-2,4-diacetamido-2,4,6-trideoxy-beta-L-altropyranose hydrolase/GNAT family N-acetyltransferase [Alkalibacterium kapii]GEK91025.1 hypothetical protein AKA01nite_06470 [Alkalibacterium kapii]